MLPLGLSHKLGLPLVECLQRIILIIPVGVRKSSFGPITALHSWFYSSVRTCWLLTCLTITCSNASASCSGRSSARSEKPRNEEEVDVALTVKLQQKLKETQLAKDKLEKKVEELEASLLKHKTQQTNVADTLKVNYDWTKWLFVLTKMRTNWEWEKSVFSLFFLYLLLIAWIAPRVSSWFWMHLVQ